MVNIPDPSSDPNPDPSLLPNVTGAFVVDDGPSDALFVVASSVVVDTVLNIPDPSSGPNPDPSLLENVTGTFGLVKAAVEEDDAGVVSVCVEVVVECWPSIFPSVETAG